MHWPTLGCDIVVISKSIFELGKRTLAKEIGICIYCQATKPLSDEHYLPRCLGTFERFEKLTGKICSDCNGGFSKLEEQFCRQSDIGFFRYRFGIAGYDHHEQVDPFLRGSAKGRAMEMYGEVDGVQLRLRPQRGERGIAPLEGILITIAEDEIVHIPLPSSPDDEAFVRGKLIETLERHKGNVVRTTLACPGDKLEYAKKFLCETGITYDEGRPFPIEGEIETKVKIQGTSFYFRALAKIGFHYFLKQMEGFFSGFENEFSDIKRFIQDGARVDEFVQTEEKDAIGFGELPKTFSHLLIAEAGRDLIRVKLQFFARPEWPMLRHTVTIGRNRSGIVLNKAHAFSYTDGNKGGYDGVMTPLIERKNTSHFSNS